MSPFFQKQYIKANSTDIFAAYGRLLAEILLVLPCQVMIYMFDDQYLNYRLGDPYHMYNDWLFDSLFVCLFVAEEDQ